MACPEFVFVYGSLRRGQVHHSLLKGARCLGRHRTAPVYTMLDLGGYPGVVTDGITAIVGEIYAVSPRILARLDRLEDFPRLYTRALIGTPFGPAWMYLMQRPPLRSKRIYSGNWHKRTRR